MDPLKGWLKQLRAVVQRNRVEGELDEELRFHLEQETAKYERAGLSPAAARERALAGFGSVDRWKEAVRNARWVRVLENLEADVRFSFRALRRSPGFAATAVVTLGLGIGATTAVFSVVEVLFFRPLPFEASERLVLAGSVERGEAPPAAPYARHAEYAAWSRESRAMDAVGAYTLARFTVIGGRDPALADALVMDAGLLPVLGVAPQLGRGFDRSHDRAGAEAVVLLSHRYWQTSFEADRGVIGRTIHLNGHPFEVLGVLPEGFSFPPATRGAEGWWSYEPALYVPLGAIAAEVQYYPFWVVGRTAPGATLDRVREELGALSEAYAAAPVEAGERDVHVVSLHEAVVGPLRPVMLAFLGAVTLVLLIACVNLGAMMMARLSVRQRELGVRLALGAGRGRIARQLLTESAVLAAIGGVAGLVTAVVALRILLGMAPADLPGQLLEAKLNPRVLLFSFAMTTLAGALCGIVPAVRASRATQSPLSSDRGGVSDRQTRRAHRVLVCAETALAVALLVASGLLIRSFGELAAVDPGFRADGVLTVDVAPPYGQRADVLAYYEGLERRLAALPGVLAVSAVDRLPFGASSSRIPVHTGASQPGGDDNAPVALNLTARAGYFAAMEIPVFQGRAFDARDRAGGPPVVVVSRSLAQRLAPGGNAVGERVSVFGATQQIVGVVGDVRHFGPAAAPEPMIYFSHETDPVLRSGMTLVIRTGASPETLAALVRAEIQAVDPLVPISNVRSLAALRSTKVAAERFNALVVGAFSALALVLVAVGIYGVMAFAIAHRTREIGVRLALGATRARVVSQILRQAAVLLTLGLALGLLAALPLARMISTLLFGVQPLDPATFAAAPLVMTVVGVLAAWLPARRAARIEPLAALRFE